MARAYGLRPRLWLPDLDNILRDWMNDKVKKGLVEASNRYEKQEEETEKKTVFFFSVLENDSENNNTRALSVPSRVRVNKTQNWS